MSTLIIRENHPNLRLHLILLDMEEYRHLNGWSHDRKCGSSRYERIPTALAEEMIIGASEDYHKLIPSGLPKQFTSRDYRQAANLSMNGSQTVLNVLHHMEAVRRVGKQGKLYLYETVKTNDKG